MGPVWDSIGAPTVIKDDDRYYMWYTEGIDDLTVSNLLDLVLGADLPIDYAYYIPVVPPPPPPPPVVVPPTVEEVEAMPVEEAVEAVEIVDAAYAQTLKLSSPPMVATTVPAIRLAAKLAQITPGSLSKVFFSTGGAEAIEIAVKIAKHYQKHAGFSNRYKIIARRGEYHGGSHLTMSLGKKC